MKDEGSGPETRETVLQKGVYGCVGGLRLRLHGVSLQGRLDPRDGSVTVYPQTSIRRKE